MAFSWARDSDQFTESVLTERSMTIPFRDGAVDWTTLGNILRSQLMGEVLLASYVDTKHCEREVDFAVDTDWKYSYEEKDVVVLQKQNAASPNFFCYMGRGVIEAPAEEIAEFLAQPRAPLSYDNHVVESRHVETVSQTDSSTNVIVYYRSEATRCLFKSVRDLLFLSSRSITDGKHTLASMSVEHPLCPPVDGIKRAQLQRGSGWLLEPYKGNETKTLVSYSLHVDLMGMPPVVSNHVLKRQPLNIYYLRKHLMESKVERSDVTYSGRHFEQPLPINSFTGHNYEQFATAKNTCTLRVEERDHRDWQDGSTADLDNAFHKGEESRSKSREKSDRGSFTSNYSTAEVDAD